MLLKEHLSIRQLFSNKMFPIHQTLLPSSGCSAAVMPGDDQQRPPGGPVQRLPTHPVFELPPQPDLKEEHRHGVEFKFLLKPYKHLL